jgi:hypothetical protein
MDADLETLVDRWMLAFCEAPVLVDADLMRAVLDDLQTTPEEPKR